jgi:hypothetical protein
VTVKNLLKVITPGRIRSQLILGITLVHVVLMSLFVAELVNRQKTSFLKLNYDRAVSLSVNFANTATPYLISFELDGLQKLASTYKNVPGIEYTMVLSDDYLMTVLYWRIPMNNTSA